MTPSYRLVTKLWRKISQHEVLSESDGSCVRTWDDLMCNSDHILREKSQELEDEYEQLTSALDDDEVPDWKTFVSICGKIVTNCFCLRSDR